jgi:hypothetical protein
MTMSHSGHVSEERNQITNLYLSCATFGEHSDMYYLDTTVRSLLLCSTGDVRRAAGLNAYQVPLRLTTTETSESRLLTLESRWNPRGEFSHRTDAEVKG